MIIYPAIDIKGGRCVRLSQGRFDRVTEYSGNPAEVARRWAQAGATHIHVVDLDGAREGRIVNGKIIEEICRVSGAFVEMGGGIRSMDAVHEALLLGVSRVILGTAAACSPGLVKEAVDSFGSKIAVGIDAKDGKAATHGWEKDSGIDALELADQVCALGVKTIIYTDIATDGMLAGPNVGAMRKMASRVKAGVIASGGVGCLEDILSLVDTGVAGVIVGRALYTGDVRLEEAIKAVNQACSQKG